MLMADFSRLSSSPTFFISSGFFFGMIFSSLLPYLLVFLLVACFPVLSNHYQNLLLIMEPFLWFCGILPSSYRLSVLSSLRSWGFLYNSHFVLIPRHLPISIWVLDCYLACHMRLSIPHTLLVLRFSFTFSSLIKSNLTLLGWLTLTYLAMFFIVF